MVLAPHVSTNEEGSKTLPLCTQLAARRISIRPGTDTHTHRGQKPQAAPALTQEILIPWGGMPAPPTPIKLPGQVFPRQMPGADLEAVRTAFSQGFAGQKPGAVGAPRLLPGKTGKKAVGTAFPFRAGARQGNARLFTRSFQ